MVSPPPALVLYYTSSDGYTDYELLNDSQFMYLLNTLPLCSICGEMQREDAVFKSSVLKDGYSYAVPQNQHVFQVFQEIFVA